MVTTTTKITDAISKNTGIDEEIVIKVLKEYFKLLKAGFIMPEIKGIAKPMHQGVVKLGNFPLKPRRNELIDFSLWGNVIVKKPKQDDDDPGPGYTPKSKDPKGKRGRR